MKKEKRFEKKREKEREERDGPTTKDADGKRIPRDKKTLLIFSLSFSNSMSRWLANPFPAVCVVYTVFCVDG